jgi:hypothetical protein
MMDSRLLASMPNLRELELGPQWHNPLLRLPALPHLDSLIFTGGSVDLSTIVENIGQPALRRLRLRNIAVGTLNMLPAPKLRSEDIPEIDGLNPTITELELEAVDIYPDALLCLLRFLNKLQCLSITISCVRQWRAMCQINGWHTIISTAPERHDSLENLGRVLRQVKDSIQCLRLWHDHRVQTKKARLRDQSLLPSFADFTKLRVLEVDPAMLVGRRRCPILTPDPPPTLPVEDFARLLPTGLEELTLSIDFEQTERYPGYQTDLIHSIISEKGRLTDLRSMNWFEDKTLSSDRCSINNSHRPPRGHFPMSCYPTPKPRWDSIAEVRASEQLAMQLLQAGVESRSMDFYDRDWWLSSSRFPIPPLDTRVDSYDNYGWVDAGQ